MKSVDFVRIVVRNSRKEVFRIGWAGKVRVSIDLNDLDRLRLGIVWRDWLYRLKIQV